MSRAVVLGGYGTFGALVSRELARLRVNVTVAGRDALRAAALARSLGPDHRGIAADATDPASCDAALSGHAVAVNCAGPFSALGDAFLESCLRARCHAVDISDDRGWGRRVRAMGEQFRDRGLAAAYGCSSLPGLSGALALVARSGAASAPDRARVTIFIGNDNPKGEAAARSLVEGLGRPVLAPQGVLRGFRQPQRVTLPGFGSRTVYTLESPDYDLLPELVGARSVAVKVGFEMRAGSALLALLACLGPRWGHRTARLLSRAGRLVRGGTPGGVVQVELFWPDGTSRRAAFHAVGDGQRMAALPAALAAQALADGSAPGRGALTAYELLGGPALVAQVTAAGYALVRE